MPDFGDEIGSSVERAVPMLLQRFLLQLKNGNYQRHAPQNTNQQGQGSEGNAPERETICTVPFDTEQERDIVARELQGQGVAFDPVLIQKPAIAFHQKDIAKVQTIIEDRIKSHDGMDVDPFTAVKESVTPTQPSAGDFSWKADIESRVTEARDGAATEKDFITRCEDRGLKVDRAKDGELMFVHPEREYWKVRGDTLGERFSRQSFQEKQPKEYKTPRLEQEAKDARDASKQLSAERDMLNRDREIPNLQSLSK